MNTDIISIVITIVALFISLYFVNTGTSIWKTLYSKKSFLFLIIPSIAASIHSGQVDYNYEGFELFFYSVIGAIQFYFIFLVMILPLIGIILAIMTVPAKALLTKKGQDFIMNGDKKDKDNG